MTRFDPDAPVAPIDPAADARRRADTRARNSRSLLGMLVLLAQPLLAVSAGALLGSRLHGAPVVGIVGMALAWGLAWSALLALGVVAAIAGLPALLRRADRPQAPGRLARAATGVALATHVLVFVAVAAMTALACAWFGTGGAGWSVLAFSVVAGGLAAMTPLAAPEAG